MKNFWLCKNAEVIAGASLWRFSACVDARRRCLGFVIQLARQVQGGQQAMFVADV